MIKFKKLFILTMLIFGAISMNGQEDIYVSQTASGLNNGSRWADAYNDLQSDLGAAVDGDQMWVAQGVYVPGLVPAKTFALIEGLKMYGAFKGQKIFLISEIRQIIQRCCLAI
jgi:hypothetical protein